MREMVATRSRVLIPEHQTGPAPGLAGAGKAQVRFKDKVHVFTGTGGHGGEQAGSAAVVSVGAQAKRAAGDRGVHTSRRPSGTSLGQLTLGHARQTSGCKRRGWGVMESVCSAAFRVSVRS